MTAPEGSLGDILPDRVRESMRRFQWRDAIKDFDALLTLRPRSAEILTGRGRCFRALGRTADALADLESALELAPDDVELAGEVAYCSLQLGLWDGLERKMAAVLSGIDRGGFAEPLMVATLPASGLQQLQAARRYFAKWAPEPLPAVRGVRRPGERLRIGYFSADFYDHATSQLAVRVFEAHDRREFEVLAYGFGYPPADHMHRRVVSAVDRYADVSTLDNEGIVRLARGDGIHIAVDLAGYTGKMRLGIFALGAAPVQVNYLTYPGTLGNERMHYIVGDPVLTPIEHEAQYAERLARLPHSYQPTDTAKRHLARRLSRAEAGLPAAGFVFANFGITAKITPDVFGIWMRLLRAVEGSRLWLMESDPAASRHLRGEAEARGVRGERLIFAGRAPIDVYLGRYAHADLVLDTFHYTGHTTGSDALLMGVPVVTRLGDTFPSRVGASLLTAVGLPELVTHSTEDYERLALTLAREPELLATFRRRLSDQGLKSPLFDSARYTRHLEKAYAEMWRRHEEGLAPDHITVQPG